MKYIVAVFDKGYLCSLGYRPRVRIRGRLDTDIYMKLPAGFEKRANRVVKKKKAMYIVRLAR